MRLSDVGAPSSALTPYRFTDAVAADVAVLNDKGGGADTGRQLGAYQALAGRWRQAGQGERAALAQVLADSPFGQKVHATLNAFTRAAWSGDNAVPPAPQARLLSAYEALSDTDRQIVAGMQTDPSTGSAYASADAYHARLKAELEAAQPPGGGRRPDTVTLSSQAQAVLAGQAPAPAAPPTSADGSGRPEVAAAMAAYARAATG